MGYSASIKGLDNLGSDTAILELNSDPVSPASGEAWILRTGAGSIADGVPIGLLLALTYTGCTGSSSSYQFSYKTASGTVVRANLT